VQKAKTWSLIRQSRPPSSAHRREPGHGRLRRISARPDAGVPGTAPPMVFLPPMPLGALTLPPRSLKWRRIAAAAIAMKGAWRRIDDPAMHDGAPEGTAGSRYPAHRIGSEDDAGHARPWRLAFAVQPCGPGPVMMSRRTGAVVPKGLCPSGPPHQRPKGLWKPRLGVGRGGDAATSWPRPGAMVGAAIGARHQVTVSKGLGPLAGWSGGAAPLQPCRVT